MISSFLKLQKLDSCTSSHHHYGREKHPLLAPLCAFVFACAVCPPNYVFYRGNCYKYMDHWQRMQTTGSRGNACMFHDICWVWTCSAYRYLIVLQRCNYCCYTFVPHVCNSSRSATATPLVQWHPIRAIPHSQLFGQLLLADYLVSFDQ